MFRQLASISTRRAKRSGILWQVSLTKSRDYKERQVDRKKRKVFVTAHLILRTVAMFSASALNRGSHPQEIEKNGSLIPWEIPLFRALANNMAPMTNH